MAALMSVDCNEITQKWNIRQSYGGDGIARIAKPVTAKFDKSWSEQYYTFSDNDKCATHKSGTWPVVRLLERVKTGSKVKFMMTKYGWFGIGNHQVAVLG